MPLFIDCYNLLHATMPPSLAGLDEDGLCRVLAASPWAGDRIVVVCDGVVKPGTPSASPVSRVELIYSGPSKTADDVIIEMAAANSAPRRLYVVTDDREIQKAVKRRKAQVISTGAFIRALATSRPAGSTIDSTARHRPALPEGEVNQWLKEFGIDPGAAPEAIADEKPADRRRAPLEREPMQTPEEAQRSLDDEEVARWLKEFGVSPDEPIDPRKREWWE
jgi:predicted RNA-binding protein with PIN domain